MSSYQEIIKQHQQKKKLLTEKSEQCKQDVLNKAAELSTNMVNCLNNGVADIFNNQRQLERETKKLHSLTGEYLYICNISLIKFNQP